MIIKNSLVTFVAISLFVLNVNSYGKEKSATINFKKLNITKQYFQNAVNYDRTGKYLIVEACLKKVIEKKGTEKYYTKACFMLANYYFESRKGIVKDKRKARKYYNLVLKVIQTKADAGDAEAQYIAGVCTQNAKHKREIAFEWLLKSANNGYADAQAAVALSLFKGKGVKRDAKAAIVWLQKANDNGSIEAKAYLASYYLGSRKNIAKGIELAKESSEAGNAAGQFTLGMAYQKGRGVAKNLKKAVELFRLAANQGQQDAILRLKWTEPLLKKKNKRISTKKNGCKK